MAFIYAQLSVCVCVGDKGSITVVSIQAEIQVSIKYIIQLFSGRSGDNHYVCVFLGHV